MSKIFFISLFIISAFTALAQNKDSEKDSVTTKSYLNGEIEYLRYKSAPSFVLLENILTPDKFDTTAGSIRLRTRMALMYSENAYGNEPSIPDNILQPYYNYYMESKNISLFRRVLGIAQLGAVGYLAYKHIKKYGLFH
jgi:hypothetical protein